MCKLIHFTTSFSAPLLLLLYQPNLNKKLTNVSKKKKTQNVKSLQQAAISTMNASYVKKQVFFKKRLLISSSLHFLLISTMVLVPPSNHATHARSPLAKPKQYQPEQA
ncbi:hypothetical protein BRARA_J02483 [Brassica rapa]|uniref:Uncharacterized protein n=1 Tax=Brassica campestris TaxID=3711 RepID=A0A397XN82_BRACM|nr:hypothetical protein BRARA_J02483 [Brassica rapa]